MPSQWPGTLGDLQAALSLYGSDAFGDFPLELTASTEATYTKHHIEEAIGLDLAMDEPTRRLGDQFDAVLRMFGAPSAQTVTQADPVDSGFEDMTGSDCELLSTPHDSEGDGCNAPDHATETPYGVPNDAPAPGTQLHDNGPGASKTSKRRKRRQKAKIKEAEEGDIVEQKPIENEASRANKLLDLLRRPAATQLFNVPLSATVAPQRLPNIGAKVESPIMSQPTPSATVQTPSVNPHILLPQNFVPSSVAPKLSDSEQEISNHPHYLVHSTGIKRISPYSGQLPPPPPLTTSTSGHLEHPVQPAFEPRNSDIPVRMDMSASQVYPPTHSATASQGAGYSHTYDPQVISHRPVSYTNTVSALPPTRTIANPGAVGPQTRLHFVPSSVHIPSSADFPSSVHISAVKPAKPTRIVKEEDRSQEDREWDYLQLLVGRFPEDKKWLVSPMHLLVGNQSTDGIHVFVDSSNILIGFSEMLKRKPHKRPRNGQYGLSLDCLLLLLERRRPVAKRIYAGATRVDAPDQEHEKHINRAGALGYEKMVYAMVCKTRKPTARQKFFRDADRLGIHQAKRLQSGIDVNSSNSDSETGAAAAPLPTPSNPVSRWVEQGVDEGLHLKMCQSILDCEKPSTMVVATGDGNVAEYSDGFLKHVERALAHGWRVEIVSWKHALSSGYRKKSFKAKWGDRLTIIELDEYVDFLMERTE